MTISIFSVSSNRYSKSRSLFDMAFKTARVFSIKGMGTVAGV